MTTRMRRYVLGASVFLLLGVGMYAGLRALVRRSTRKACLGLGASFDFDDAVWRHIPDRWRIGREIAPIELDVSSPCALTVGPGDDIYVAGASEVAVLNRGGQRERHLSIAGARCLAVAVDGSIYAGIGNHIEVYDADGALRVRWGSSERNARISCIALTEEGVFATDRKNSRLLRYDASGREQGRVGGFVLFANPGFDVGAAPGGGVWAVNAGRLELRRYNADLQVVASWQRIGRDVTGFSGCCNPTDIAVRSDGTIVTSEKNIVRVKIVTSSGDLIGVLAGPDAFDNATKRVDLAADSADRVLVLDTARNQVRVFLTRGVDTDETHRNGDTVNRSARPAAPASGAVADLETAQ